jgi:hypothetical protein
MEVYAMSGIIEITIAKDGSSVDMDGQNFEDCTCGTLTAGLAEKIGTEIDGDKKPEFYVERQGGIGQGA